MKRNVQALARTLLAGAVLAAVVGVVVGARLASSWITHEPERAEQARQRQIAEHEGTEVPILCVGSSHTASRWWIPGYSFPDQLEGILKDRYPGVPFTVKNAAKFGLTSEGVLKSLAEELGRKKYRWVAIMIGELRDGGVPQQAPAPVKPEAPAPAKPGRSLRFPEVPTSDSSTLAMKWAGLLSQFYNWRVLENRPELSAEALAALTRWKPDPSGESKRTVLGVRALLLAREGRISEAVQALRLLLAAAGSSYDLFAELVVEELEKRVGKRDAATVAELKRALAARKISPGALAAARLAFRGQVPTTWDVEAGDRARLVEEAISAAPGQMLLYGLLIRLPAASAGKTEVALHARTESIQGRGYWENPFQPGQPTGPQMARTRPTDGDFLRHFSRRFPSLVFSSREAVAEADPALTLSQIREAVRLVRASGGEPILQTYPIYRRVGSEREADGPIREVAAREGVPLADVAEEIRLRTKTVPLDTFFAEPGELVDDDHMNRKGNEVMARQLLRVLEASPDWSFPRKAEP